MAPTQSRQAFRSFAPSPAVLESQGSNVGSDEGAILALDSTSGHKKRKRASSVDERAEDNRFLVHLKDKECLTWKEIVTRFQTDRGKTLKVAALQMRYRRHRHETSLPRA